METTITKRINPEQQTVKPQTGIEVIKANVKARMSAIAEYFNMLEMKQQKRPLEKVLTVEDYKANYTLLDGKLGATIANLVNDFLTKKAYHFGYETTGFDYGTGSKLLKSPCNCGGEKKLSVQDKKSIRLQAENYLMKWVGAAKIWLNNGAQELSLQNQNSKVVAKAVERATKPTRPVKFIRINKPL